MGSFNKGYGAAVLFTFMLFKAISSSAQDNLLLNGGFEDVNTCTEYNSECGVEAWFYLKDVKAQMLPGDGSSVAMGSNSFGLYYNWLGFTGFSPVLGTILPCILQKGKQYIFSGMLSAKLNNRLILQPGIALGEKFYVPKRPFSRAMHPDSIVQITSTGKNGFYSFEYRFIATGDERYLTFGTFIREDTTAVKKTMIGVQTISLIMDNFQLIAADDRETICPVFDENKKKIYHYNFRHKEMDYSLFGKGLLTISLNNTDSNVTTTKELVLLPTKPVTDTLKLGDVLFDFNKANLKPAAIRTLEQFFKVPEGKDIDSIYIEGHTDSIGNDDRNIELSMQRSEGVRQWLESNSILPADRMRVYPFGKSKPIATNKTAAGRALNRRVEIIIFRKRTNTGNNSEL